MSRQCSCHSNRAALLDAGFTFHTSRRVTGRLGVQPSGYHEHRCECACGCSRDTSGYIKCAYCSWECVGYRRVPPLAKVQKFIARAKPILAWLKRST